MSKDELVKELLKLAEDKKKGMESSHIEADALLLKYINSEEVETAFDSIDKWYN